MQPSNALALQQHLDGLEVVRLQKVQSLNSREAGLATADIRGLEDELSQPANRCSQTALAREQFQQARRRGLPRLCGLCTREAVNLSDS
jgi:hypothetical protein